MVVIFGIANSVFCLKSCGKCFEDRIFAFPPNVPGNLMFCLKSCGKCFEDRISAFPPNVSENSMLCLKSCGKCPEDRKFALSPNVSGKFNVLSGILWKMFRRSYFRFPP